MAWLDLYGSVSHLAAVKGSRGVAVIWDLIDLEYLLPSSLIWLFTGNFSSSLYEPQRRAAPSMASSRAINKRERDGRAE